MSPRSVKSRVGREAREQGFSCPEIATPIERMGVENHRWLPRAGVGACWQAYLHPRAHSPDFRIGGGSAGAGEKDGKDPIETSIVSYLTARPLGSTISPVPKLQLGHPFPGSSGFQFKCVQHV
uniref:Uncharacterized protein n=1 Tax=Candidatus Kentrum sp. DK TaxID=2126562 RepID=A0A450SQK8_9GAMM|nr:MAG: hypothetical protein BECKDK2373B_GA0170837_105718 [Candidatus Kentron sp. DK]VFJ61512.1 MAG: hypothetical protein BECKDK2373C_GA0170839_108919 [Candidatus Kentron sp. DK]